MRYKCNAKINLTLKVLGKKDEMHLIESIILPISIYDEIEMVERTELEDDEIVGMTIPKETNIMYKMLKLLKEKFGVDRKYLININKNIPMMAGLGGGSSDAFGVLKMFIDLNNISLSDEEMIKLCLKIGMDVSFFIYNKASFVKGFGEQIEPIKSDKLVGILIFDDDYCSTKEIYQRFDENTDKTDLYNDLEKGLDVITREKINRIKEEMILCGACYSSMSGSGGSVFGLFDDMNRLNQTFEILKGKYRFVQRFETL